MVQGGTCIRTVVFEYNRVLEVPLCPPMIQATTVRFENVRNMVCG